MPNYNKAILIGHLVADPEIRHTANGKTVANGRIAVTRPKFGEGKPETDFFSFSAWEKTAESLAKYAGKGKAVLLEGAMQNRKYEKDGVERQVTELHVSNWTFADSNRDGAAAAAPKQDLSNYGNTDLPSDW